jgi:hypothetical protein
MDLHSYLEAVRDSYAQALRRAAAAALQGDGKVLLEATIDRSPRKYRFDLVHIGADGGVKTEMVRASHQLPWQPRVFRIRGTFDVQVEHFLWCACTIIVKPAPPAEPLRAWFDRWFEGSGLTGSPGPLSNAVHYLGDLDVDDGRLRIDVDLGTAPVDAFLELLEVVADSGATQGVVFTPDGD